MTLTTGLPAELWLKVFESEDALWHGEYKRHLADLFTNPFSVCTTTENVKIKVDITLHKKNLKKSNFYKRDDYVVKLSLENDGIFKSIVNTELLSLQDYKDGERVYALNKYWKNFTDVNNPDDYTDEEWDLWVGNRNYLKPKPKNMFETTTVNEKKEYVEKLINSDEFKQFCSLRSIKCNNGKENCSNWCGFTHPKKLGRFMNNNDYAPYEQVDIYHTTPICDKCWCEWHHRVPNGWDGDRAFDSCFIESGDCCRLCNNMKHSTDELLTQQGNFCVIAKYTQESYFKCSWDLEKVMANGGSWYIKYNTLYIKPHRNWDDSDMIEIEGNLYDTDYKYADSEEIVYPEEIGDADEQPFLLNHKYDKNGYIIESDSDED